MLGNQLVDDAGAPVVLHGVNRSGSEYMCIDGWGIFDGPTDQASIDAMKVWNVNAVRVPLNSACWLDIVHQFGSHDVAYAGQAYQDAITQFVERLTANGINVILDLQWTGCGEAECLANWLKPLPERAYATQFWTQVAGRFKDNHRILFDLFNEPYGVDWSCWQDGGCALGGQGQQYTAEGMQQMVNAIRAAGAVAQPILLGGLQYSNDMSGWLSHLPSDPSDSLVASIHLYNSNWPCPLSVSDAGTAADAITCFSDEQHNAIDAIAAEHPVVFGELGQDGCASDFVAPMLEWIGQRGFSVLGWAWNTADCSGFPALISNYDGTPTALGEAFRAHYLGEPVPSPSPTLSESAWPSESPTGEPSDAASPSVSEAPTETPSDSPTPSASGLPSDEPSESPSPSDTPTGEQTEAPSPSATPSPSSSSSVSPSPVVPVAAQVISRGVPAFASSGNASTANDDSYATAWQLSADVNAWLAYDLSGVPTADRDSVVLAWYTELDDGYTTGSIRGGCPAYAGRPFLADYSIQVNSAAGGAEPPVSGWRTVASVTGNLNLSGQHLVDFAGDNWIRVQGSGVNGVSVNVDVASAPSGDSGGWLFMGDSVTAANAGHASMTGPSGESVAGIAQLLAAGTDDRFQPLVQNDGVACSHATDAVTWIDRLLDGFHGHYVTLNFGTNDAWAGQGDVRAFRDAMTQLVEAVESRGMVAVVPTVPWPNNGGDWDEQVQRMNDQIRLLYQSHPGVLPGPDLYALLQGRPELFVSQGDVHPNEAGRAVVRRAWADTILGSVYLR